MGYVSVFLSEGAMAISFANSSHNHDMYSYTHKMYIWIECLAQTELHVVSECQLPVSRDLGQLYTVFGRGNFSTSPPRLPRLHHNLPYIQEA